MYPVLSCLACVIILAATLPVTIGPAAGPWRSINDGVMGGLSEGRMVAAESGLRFEGHLSLENNGGFASVRRPVDSDLSGSRNVKICVRGDGRRYQFRLRMDEHFDGVAWRSEFPTSPSWQYIELPLSGFEPVFRGRIVSDAGPVISENIHQIGFMLADKQPGPFRLEVRSIEFH